MRLTSSAVKTVDKRELMRLLVAFHTNRRFAQYTREYNQHFKLKWMKKKRKTEKLLKVANYNDNENILIEKCEIGHRIAQPLFCNEKKKPQQNSQQPNCEL